MVTLDDSETIVLIECKGSIEDHSMFNDVSEYINYGYGTPVETEKYAINGYLINECFNRHIIDEELKNAKKDILILKQELKNHK